MISVIQIALTLYLIGGWINSSKSLRGGCGRLLKYPYLAMEKVNVMACSLTISNSVVKLAEIESVNISTV